MKQGSISRSIMFGSLLSLLLPLPVWADAIQNQVGIPNTESMQSELEPERKIVPKEGNPHLDLKAPSNLQPDQKLTANVRQVVFDCQEQDVNPLLQVVTSGKLGRQMNFEQMQVLAVDATKLLRKKGYMTALVYIPEQELDIHGVLRMKVILGRYGDVNITNHSQLTDERLLGYTYPLRPGQVIKAQPLDKTLLVLNDLPGVQAKGSLAPGNKPGTAKLILDASTLEKQGGYLYVDDYGSKSTGRWRFGGSYHYNNVSKVGDQIEVSYLRSNGDLKNYEFRYNVPVGNDGAIARVSYSRMNYTLGNRWDFLHSDGLAKTMELGVTVPMKRTLKYSSWYDVSYRNRSLDDSYFNNLNESKKSTDSVQFEIHGYVQEPVYSTTYSIAHTMGNLGMDSSYAAATDLQQTAGWYSKTNASLYHIQQLSNRLQLHISLSGQYAWKNLDGSEDFFIGGPSGVRAFPQGETGGDSGLLGTLEFRYRTGVPGLQLTAFVDGGRVFFNRDELPNSMGSNVKNLAGAGLGFIYSHSRKWYAKFDWATPLGNHYSDTEGEDVHSAWWLRVVKQF